MPYGPSTNRHIVKLASGEAFSSAAAWSPDDFTLPFAERLAENIAEYHDLPSGYSTAAILHIIQEGADRKGIKLARNTLNEWLNGGRDPSVSSSDAQTRNNIYKLCAALDYDYELTTELFEKVFFTRAFNPKDLKELAFRFFALRDYNNGTEGCSWFQAGENACRAVEEMNSPALPQRSITNSSLIIDKTSAMNEAEFLAFLASNPATFQKENQNAGAKAAVVSLACRACEQTSAIGKVSDVNEIPYETLINHILGYAQRSVQEAAGTVSSLTSLPAQLTTNFPTGQILRKICLGEACSYDQVFKMMSLLLFTCFFARQTSARNREANFKEFLRFANMSLDRVGYSELYPCQPYGGLLLFCAAQDAPPAALRRFIAESIAEESEAVLQEELKSALPSAKNSDCLAVVRAAGRDPFSVRLIAGTLARGSCSLSLSALAEACETEDTLLQTLYDHAGFTEDEKSVLRYAALLPPEGVPQAFRQKIFPSDLMPAVQSLLKCRWLEEKKGLLSMHYRVRSLINDQIDFPTKENCADMIRNVSSLQETDLDAKEKKLAEKIKKKIRSL